LHLVGYLYNWQMGFNSVFKGLMKMLSLSIQHFHNKLSFGALEINHTQFYSYFFKCHSYLVQRKHRINLRLQKSRPALRPARPSMQMIYGAPFPKLKQVCCKADHTLPFKAEVKKMRRCKSTRPYTCTACTSSTLYLFLQSSEKTSFWRAK